jgi:hypothetical protein
MAAAPSPTATPPPPVPSPPHRALANRWSNRHQQPDLGLRLPPPRTPKTRLDLQSREQRRLVDPTKITRRSPTPKTQSTTPPRQLRLQHATESRGGAGRRPNNGSGMTTKPLVPTRSHPQPEARSQHDAFPIAAYRKPNKSRPQPAKVLITKREFKRTVRTTQPLPPKGDVGAEADHNCRQ